MIFSIYSGTLEIEEEGGGKIDKLGQCNSPFEERKKIREKANTQTA